MRTAVEEIAGRAAAATEIFIATPPAEREDLGTIAVFADVSDLPAACRYLGALIAGAAKRGFFGDPGRGAEGRFARALTAINDALAEEAKNGTAQWVGTLRACVVATADRTVLLSQSGGCAAMLLRSGAVTDIPMESGEGSRPFGALTTGTLKEDDEIAIASRTTFVARDAKRAFAHDPKKFFASIRRAEGIAVLRIHAEPTERRMRSALPAAFTAFRLPHLPPMHFPRLPHVRPALPSFRWQPLHLLRDASSLLRRIPFRVPAVPRIRISRSAAAAAGLFILIAIGAATITHHRTKKSEDFTALIGAARDVLQQGEAQLILNNLDDAMKTFDKGIAMLNTVSGNRDADALRAELIARRNATAGLIPATAETVLSLRGFPVMLDPARLAAGAADGTTLLALAGTQHPAFWLNDRLEATGGTFLFLPPPFKGGIRDIAALPSGSFVIASDDGLALTAAEERTIAWVKDRQAEKAFGFLAVSGKNVFALLPQAGTISLLTVSEDGSVTEQPWLRRHDPTLMQALDLAAIGGDPVILLPDKTFVRFRNGKKLATYRIEGYGWNGQARALAPLPGSRLLVLDPELGRLLLTNEKGDITAQIELPELRGARDLTVMPDGSAALILTSEAIYRIVLPNP